MQMRAAVARFCPRGRNAWALRGEAGGFSFDLRAEPSLLERLLYLIEGSLLRWCKVGRGIHAIRSEKFSPVRAPYLDGVLRGEE